MTTVEDWRRAHDSDLNWNLAKLRAKVHSRAGRKSEMGRLENICKRWFEAVGVALVWAVVITVGITFLIQIGRWGMALLNWML